MAADADADVHSATNPNPTSPPMNLPTIDLDVYLSDPSSSSSSSSAPSPALLAECTKAASALITHGALLLHDPRVLPSDNDACLDLLEDYFAQPEAVLRRDERPHLSYQVGVTLGRTERPSCAVDESCLDVIRRLEPSQRPLDVSAREPDPKCRFFWRMGAVPPYETLFPGLNAGNVVPGGEQFRGRWEGTMDRWGGCMRDAVAKLSEMLAIGLHLPPRYFSDAGKYGPHLLAPTASDLTRYTTKDTILAGFHTDLNFLTIHGPSRYPGLHIWARNTGDRIAVRFPPPPSGGQQRKGSLLLVQAGRQLEHLTGGLILAGYHEVVVNEHTLEAVARRRRECPERPLVRISSTLFWHLNSDFDLVPVGKLAERAARVREEQSRLGRDEGVGRAYLPVKVGEQVERELKGIELMASEERPGGYSHVETKVVQ